MAITNRDRISKTIDLLVEGLQPFVEREIRATNGQEPLERRLPGSQSYDLAELLRVMDMEWNPVFRRTLGRSERSFAHELRDVRNAWAHNEPFTYSDTFRAIDTASRLLKSISAKQAEEVEQMGVEVQRVQFDGQRRTKTRDRKQASLDVNVVSQSGLTRWRDVVTPHQDVRSGTFAQAQFAADLQQILSGTADTEYGDPKEFFNRTHLTRGIQDLLTNSVDRLSGKGGDPVAELQTNFGGGKTHSMIALYHLFGGVSVGNLPQVESFLKERGVTSLPRAHRAVLVGTALNPGEPWTKADGTVVNTFWGEMAHQLGGPEAYALVKSNDENGTSPGSELLAQLLSKYSPSLILVDEWVAYARQTYGKTDVSGGSFESNMTFAQALTEAASRVKDSLVVASLPVSDRFGSDGNQELSQADQIEVGGTAGRMALDSLRDFFQRKAVQWSPASVEESFEIVRRRLFEPLTTKDQFTSRDAVIRAFGGMYSDNSADFPQRAGEARYTSQFEISYPIHPALFTMLYEGWGSLERFQRTRGVLRLMAAVIHALWESNDDGLMIMPGSVPIDSDRVTEELTRYLEDNWRPVISRDVDGAESLPLQLDRNNANFGRVSATRRVARAVYMGSAPLLHAQHRGLEDREVKLGVVQPGESPATFGDSLRGLADRATHLYSDGSRYWYEIRPSIAREAQDRAQRLETEPVAVQDEIRERLREEARVKGDFTRVFAAPHSSGDFDDASEAGLVVLGPEVSHKTRDKKSDAWTKAEEFLKNRGNGPRINRNSLVFLTADRARLDEVTQSTRMYLAWQSISEDLRNERIELSKPQRDQVTSQLNAHNDTVNHRLREAYSSLLVPVQPDPSKGVDFQEYRLSGSDALAERVSKKLKSEEQLITQFAGSLLRRELDRVLWKDDQDHISVRQLWEYFSQHVYLPRLRDASVLHDAIVSGVGPMMVQDEGFGYADLWDEEKNRYVGLLVGHEDMVKVRVTESGLVVKPQIALRQKNAEVAATTGSGGEEGADTGSDGPDGGNGGSGGESEVKQPRRYYGSVALDSDRVGRDAGQIAEEIIAHLSGLAGADVKVTLEVSAEIPEGVPDTVVRTVTENSRTLKFENHGFEES